LSTYDSRGGIEPLVALGVRLRALGAAATLLLEAVGRDRRPVPAWITRDRGR
jgi:hypothetical protein